MNKFKKGDIVYHKATHKRGVVKGSGRKDSLLVTTEDNKVKSYQPEELWTEEEWNERIKNLMTEMKD